MNHHIAADVNADVGSYGRIEGSLKGLALCRW